MLLPQRDTQQEGPGLKVTGPGQGNMRPSFRFTCYHGAHPKREITDLAVPAPAAPSPPSDDTIYCGYVSSGQGFRGGAFNIPAETNGLHYYINSYIISGECRCEFFGHVELEQSITGPAQGNLQTSAYYVYCFHDGPSNHGEVENFSKIAPRDQEIASCGYVYSERGLRGDVFSLPDSTPVDHDFLKSYTIQGECICEFYNQTDSRLETINGPAQGNLRAAALHAVCIHSRSYKRDEAEALSAIVPRANETVYCGYIYDSQGLRGHVDSLPSEALLDAIGTSFKSYIISGGCNCEFYNSDGSRFETVKGPGQGNLLMSAQAVFCIQSGSSKRDEVKALSEEATSAVDPRADETANCGDVYTSVSLVGQKFSLLPGIEVHSSGYFRSYSIPRCCRCRFFNRNGNSTQTVTGPADGGLAPPAYGVIFTERGSSEDHCAV